MTTYCISCWAELTPVLARLGSLRCQTCRDGLTERGPGASGSRLLDPRSVSPFADTAGVKPGTLTSNESYRCGAPAAFSLLEVA